MVGYIEWCASGVYIRTTFFPKYSHIYNFADDMTLSAFSTNPDELLYNLEYDIQPAIMWFDNNYSKLNKHICHFIVSNNITEHLWAKVSSESCEEKLLGVIIDKILKL